MGERKLVQIHHLFQDGHTDFIAQRELLDFGEMATFLKECQDKHPTPKGFVVWLVCTQLSEHFLKGKSNG